jgi:urease gamma subunit
MSGFGELVDGDRMLAILQALAGENDGRLNDGLLQKWLEHMGHRMAKQVVRTLLNRLADLGAVIVHRPMDGFYIAEITQAGQDHLDRRSVLDGVARPPLPSA